MRVQEFIIEQDEDEDYSNLPSIESVKANINRVLAAAQHVYDDWNEEDRDTYAGGGICHIIADAICDIMWDVGIECTPVSCSYEQHVYVAAKFAEGVYTIDIPYHIYETGGGFSWKKIPDIKFDARDVVFYRVSGDPAEFDNYVGESQHVAESRQLPEDQVLLDFKTVNLTPNQIVLYTKKYFEAYNIDAPHGKFISNIKRFSSNKLLESTETQEIKPFIDLVQSLDYTDNIQIGDRFSVLEFEILFAHKEIIARGFANPKKVVKIKLHSDGKINYIMFDDGDRYPRLTPARYQGQPISYAVYFNKPGQVDSALTALMLKVPQGWDVDINDVERNINKNQKDQVRNNKFENYAGSQESLKQQVAEGIPQPGPSSGAPKQFGTDAEIQTRQMTAKDIISSVSGVPYYNNVVDDWDAKDYSWGVTKKVIEYATYLKKHPETLSQLPPVIVLNDKFEDGAHRVSALWLLQQRMDPKNPLWKNAKLNVQFVKQGLAESEKALQFATQAHLGQTRSGGEPYITHPVRVAEIVKQYKQSHNIEALIDAALLHDTIEDTDTTHEALKDLFGGLTASLVKELTSDLEAIKKVGKSKYLANKMAHELTSWALVIKLADRLDNVQDIATAKTPEWRARYKKETEDMLLYLESTRELSGTHQRLINAIRKKLDEVSDQQGVAEENLSEFAPSPDYRDDDDRQEMPLMEFAEIIKLFLGSEYTMVDHKRPEQVSVKFYPKDKTSGHNGAILYSVIRRQNEYPTVNFMLIDYEQGPEVGRGRKAGTAIPKTRTNALKIADIIYNTMGLPAQDRKISENFADGKNPGRKGLAKRMGVPTKASVSKLRQIAKSSSGEKQRMAHWMANMKAGKKK